MYASQNQFTARMTGGCRREEIKDLERLEDVAVHEVEDALLPHVDYPSFDKERWVGHLMLAHKIDATEAYRRLGEQSIDI